MKYETQFSGAATVLIIAGLLWSIPYLTGWSRIVRRYPMTGVASKTTYVYQPVAIGKTSYNFVTLGISQEGLELKPDWPFSYRFHAIFIPWGEINIPPGELRKIEDGRISLEVGHPPITDVMISTDLMMRIDEMKAPRVLTETTNDP